MQITHISAFLETKLPEQIDNKIKYPYQELGLEMQNWFPKAERNWMWSLFYKYGEARIRASWKAIQQTNIHSVRYLVGIIKKN